VLAFVALISSLLFLYAALDASSNQNYPSSWFYALGLPQTSYPHIVTMVYLKISISDFLTLFSARTQDKPFFGTMPSKILLFGAMFSLMLSTLVASFYPVSQPDGMYVQGLAILTDDQKAAGVSTSQYLMPLFVWIFCIIFWFIQDAAKIGAYKFLEITDLFYFRTLQDPDRKAGQKLGSPKTPAHDTDDKASPLVTNQSDVSMPPKKAAHH